MGDDVESNTGVDLAAHVDAFYPGGAAPRQQRSSSMEDLGPAEVVPTTSDNDEKSVGGTSILSRGSSKLSEAADAAFKQLSADSDISLRFQALFQLSLIATATVSLFVWMPRATFGSTAAIELFAGCFGAQAAPGWPRATSVRAAAPRRFRGHAGQARRQ